jgi:CRP/FNR family transcriptional regulator, cyclic AMP receptor protein
MKMSAFRQCHPKPPMENPNAATDVRAWLDTTVFAQLPEVAMIELVASSRIERFEVPTLINAAHQPLTHLRLVTQGSMEVVVRRATGVEVALADFGPGGWVTWLACFMQAPPEHDFYSRANTACIALPAHTVRELFAAHPALFPLIIEEIGTRMRLLMQWTGQSVTASPVKRMARLIGVLLEAQGNSEPSGILRATQERLARLARCSRQTANGLLRELEKQQLIELAYGHIKAPNAKALATFAEE